MFSLNIQGEIICFRDIKLSHLPQILKWYNKVDDFKFATGIDKPITLQNLTQKYAEVAICSNEFFVGIYIDGGEKMIGILKGRLKYKNKDAVWLSSIVIDPGYQGRGYGRMTMDLLLGYMKTNIKAKSMYIAVIEENLQGRTFWNKQDFKEIRKIENHLKLQDRQQNVIIMCRQI